LLDGPGARAHRTNDFTGDAHRHSAAEDDDPSTLLCSMPKLAASASPAASIRFASERVRVVREQGIVFIASGCSSTVIDVS